MSETSMIKCTVCCGCQPTWNGYVMVRYVS